MDLPTVSSSSNNQTEYAKNKFEDARFVSSVLNSTEVGIWEWDLETNKVSYSATVAVMLGITLESFEQSFDTYLNVVYRDDVDHFRNSIASAISQNEIQTVQHRIVLPGNSIRWIECEGIPHFSKEGKALRLSGIVRDITSRKEAELQIQKREKLLTVLAELTRKLFHHSDWNTAMSQAFEQIGKITEADRVYLFKVDEHIGGPMHSVSQVIEWNSGTSEPQLSNPALQNMVLTDYEPIFFRLRDGEGVTLLTEELENKKLQAILQDQEIKSVLIFPIHVNSEFWGFLGFDQCTHARIWSDVEFSALQSFSVTLSGSIEKHQAATEKDEWKTKHELIVKASGQIIYDLDIPTGHIEWSGSVLEELGLTSDELGGIQEWIEMIHPEDRNYITLKYQEAKDSLSGFDVYYRLKDNSGNYKNIHNKGHFLESNGIAYRMLGVMMDVTEKVRHEAEKKEIENAYTVLFNNTPDAIIIASTDLPARIISANKAAATMHGYELEEFNKLFVSDIKDNDFSSVFNERLKSLLDGDRTNVESQHKRKDGTAFPVMVVSGVINVRGQNYVMSIYRDLSDTKDTRHKLMESLSLLTATLDATADGIMVTNRDGKITASNKKFFKLWNLPVESAPELDHNKFLEHAGALVKDSEVFLDRVNVLIEGLNEKSEDLIHLKDGRIFHRYSKPQRIGNSVVGRVWSFRDISARIEYERSLEESQARFKRLQEASYGGICIHKNGVIIDANHGLSVITGYTTEELIGMNGLEKLVAPEYVSLIMKNIHAGYDKPYDIEGIRKDGSRCFLEIQGKDIPYRDSTVRVTEFRDVTTRKKAEQLLSQEKTRLSSIAQNLTRKNEQLEEFTQIVSHNLRSPVGNISTLLGLHGQAKNEEEKAEMVNLLRQTSDSLLTTLNELNDVLKIRQNENIERQNLLFSEVFDRVYKMFHAKVMESSAEVTCDFDEAPNVNYANIYLESIFLNLLSNSIKYRKSKVPPKIHFRSEIKAGCIMLYVADNGMGINLEKFGHQIFKMRKTFHDHPDSRGIGLFMVKNQVESMGGEISVESKENEGTTFIINFNKNLQ